MVQPSDEEFKPYRFKISDFMKLLGLETKTKYTEIPKITKGLLKKVFEIREGKTLIQTAWLAGAKYEECTGYVELTFSPYLKPYMLQLKERFTQYQLANVLSMKSKYSPRIYEILKCNQFKKQGCIELSIEDLRKLLKAESVYTLYADFKKYVLLRTQKELKKTSDIFFEFAEVKTGRKVTSIKFYIKQNKTRNEIAITSLEDPKQQNIDDMSNINLIKAIINENISNLEALKILNAAEGSLDKVKEKYNIISQMSKVNNVVGAIIKALKENWTTTGKSKDGIFNDYEQRDYDFEELEKRLLDWE